MKRTIPLLVTALSGLILIVSEFIPITESFGDAVAIWFDVLASVAFLLGGGNLLHVNLRKISDRRAGWGYAAVTLVAFLVTLVVGLAKVGARPAQQQEALGETFAPLALAELPETMQFTQALNEELPAEKVREPLPLTVRAQLQLDPDGRTLTLRGWLQPSQKSDLLSWHETLFWQAAIEKLAETAKPPDPWADRLRYDATHRALAWKGPMTEGEAKALDLLFDDPAWKRAIAELKTATPGETRLFIGRLPEAIDPKRLPKRISYDAATQSLIAQGPLAPANRSEVSKLFERIRPLPPTHREAILKHLDARGEALNEAQRTAFERTLAGDWTVKLWRQAIDDAEAVREVPRTAGEMYADLLAQRAAGKPPEIQATKPTGSGAALNDAQAAALAKFADDHALSREALLAELRSAGPLTPGQEAAALDFLDRQPTVGQRNRKLWKALLAAGPLSQEQSKYLLQDYREETAFTQQIDALIRATNPVKYAWSGSYRAEGTPFWWLFQYVFRPLISTMFSLLAFYVASAAFRAFRAKNVEASLLLGTAFVILLSRTYLGPKLSDLLPESLDFLRTDNLALIVMKVFNTAGTRAIMIGIALGIASTSLKVLLGIDRSYLGSGDD